jgi:uncharacterized membrane protein YjgN (DUF898 family)
MPHNQPREGPLNQEPRNAGEHHLPLRFVGSGSEYFRIWIVNLLLTLVTLGLYYPFAKVRRLRYFHGATEVGGHPLSFHADPWKMLRGYLLVALMFAAYAGAGYFSPAAGAAAFCIVAALWPALWHSSLRFRLANTGWRGLRFHFTGTRADAYRALAPGIVAAFLVVLAGLFGPAPEAGAAPDAPPPELTLVQWVAVLLPVLMLPAMPALLWLMRRYQQGHLALGAEQTRFQVRLRSFYFVALKALALLMGFGFVVGFVAAAVAGGLAAAGEGFSLAKVLFTLVPVMIVLLLLQVVVLPYFITRLQNLVWNGTRSRSIWFESKLRVRSMMALSLRNWLLIIVTLGLYFPFAAVATARLRLEAVALSSELDPDQLFSQVERAQESAAGDAAADIAGIDLGL